jgi:formylglycine-generating enzyme required for sulfatase activity
VSHAPKRFQNFNFAEAIGKHERIHNRLLLLEKDVWRIAEDKLIRRIAQLVSVSPIRKVAVFCPEKSVTPATSGHEFTCHKVTFDSVSQLRAMEFLIEVKAISKIMRRRAISKAALFLFLALLLSNTSGGRRAATDTAARSQAAAGEFTHALIRRDKTMALISKATFQMGTDATDVARLQQLFGVKHAEIFADEVPRHTVTLDSFYLDKFEVTNAEFKKFIDQNPQWHPRNIPDRYQNGNYLKDWSGDEYPKGKANHPVVNVSWYAAVAYCQWMKKRLPTEAEWEYAARGGLKDKMFPWGDEPADKTRANYGQSGIGGTTPVASYPANGSGLFDMAGNVWEYLADEWRAYPSSTQVNPVAGGNLFLDNSFYGVTTRRVIRGGSWGGSPINLRVTYRDSHPPENAKDFVGFRCASSTNAPPRS